MNNGNKFYKDLLADICIDTDDEGRLSKVLPDGKRQAVKDTSTGVPYALPTSALLRNHIDDFVFFHPLSEHLNRGEPKVIQAMRGWVVFHFCELAQTLALQLMEAGASLDVQKTMNTRQAAYLKYVGEVDHKTVEALSKVIRSTDKAPSRRFLTINMTNATDSSRSWLRQANLSFPVLDGDDDEAPFEVKGLRKSDIRAIRGMMKYIYGTLWEVAAASDKAKVEIGSGNQIAPYFDAMVQTILQLAELFRQKAKLHRKVLTQELYDKCNAKLDWVELLGNYDEYRKLIPVVDNEEVVETPVAAPVADKPKWALNAGATQQPVRPAVNHMAPQTPPPSIYPQQPVTGKVKSLAEFNAERMAKAQQQQTFDPYRQNAAQGYQMAPQQAMTPQQMMMLAQMQQQQQQGAYGYGMMPQPGYGGMQMPMNNSLQAYNHQALMQQQYQQQGGYNQGHRPGTLAF